MSRRENTGLENQRLVYGLRYIDAATEVLQNAQEIVRHNTSESNTTLRHNISMANAANEVSKDIASMTIRSVVDIFKAAVNPFENGTTEPNDESDGEYTIDGTNEDASSETTATVHTDYTEEYAHNEVELESLLVVDNQESMGDVSTIISDHMYPGSVTKWEAVKVVAKSFSNIYQSTASANVDVANSAISANANLAIALTSQLGELVKATIDSMQSTPRSNTVPREPGDDSNREAGSGIPLVVDNQDSIDQLEEESTKWATTVNSDHADFGIVEKLKAELAKMHEELEGVVNENANLVEDQSKKDALIQTLQSEIKSLAHQKALLEENSSLKIDLVKLLQNRVADLTKDKETLAAKNEFMIQKLQNRALDLFKNKLKLRDDAAKNEALVEKLQKEVVDLVNKKEKAIPSTALDAEVSSLKSTKSELEEDMADLKVVSGE